MQDMIVQVLQQAFKISDDTDQNGITEKILSSEEIGRDIHPYDGEFCGRLIKIVPLKEQNTLEIKFYFPSDPQYRKKKLLGYFSHLLGHESDGSLHSLLVSENLALGLTTSTYVLDHQFSSLKISISLTENGLGKIPDVVEVVGAYIQMLRSHSPQIWIHEELRNLSEIRFMFLTKANPYSTCVGYADCLNNFPPE